MVETEEGVPCMVDFQIADVSKPLMSVGKICDQGHEVVFRRDGGVIRSLYDGTETRFARDKGLYMLNIWSPLPDGQGFTRPGK